MRAVLLLPILLLTACSALDSGDAAPGAPPAAATAQAPTDATGLGDLAALSGIESLDEGDLVPTILGYSLHESSGRIKGQIRGTLTNASGHVITGGDLRFVAEVGFDDGCPGRVEGAKGLGTLRISETNPWRPGDELEFTISSDEHLAGITGEFAASQVRWSLQAYVEDPLCWRARGTLREFDGDWSAATVGSPATGPATTNRRVQLTSAADGGTRVETLDEGVKVTVAAVKGKKLRVRTPGGVEGWASIDHLDLGPNGLTFQ